MMGKFLAEGGVLSDNLGCLVSSGSTRASVFGRNNDSRFSNKARAGNGKHGGGER